MLKQELLAARQNRNSTPRIRGELRAFKSNNAGQDVLRRPVTPDEAEFLRKFSVAPAFTTEESLRTKVILAEVTGIPVIRLRESGPYEMALKAALKQAKHIRRTAPKAPDLDAVLDGRQGRRAITLDEGAFLRALENAPAVVEADRVRAKAIVAEVSGAPFASLVNPVDYRVYLKCALSQAKHLARQVRRAEAAGRRRMNAVTPEARGFFKLEAQVSA